MKITESIENAEMLNRWLQSEIDGIEFKGELRIRLAVGSLDIALEHHTAIIALMKNNLFGSAFALIRIQFESYVRGLWLYHCATEQELCKFRNEKLDKDFGALISELEQIETFNSGVLVEAKRRNWKFLNSLTHTGFSQIVRRQTEKFFEPRYEDVEVITAISFVDAVVQLTGCAIAVISNNKNLANKILDRIILNSEIKNDSGS